MSTLLNYFKASVAQKFIMALTGIGFVLFVITHLLGNLALYCSDGTKFNLYANALHELGGLLIIAELGLLGLLSLHVMLALALKFSHKMARDINYKVVESRGAPSKGTAGSRNMIVSGCIMLAFIIFHVWQFKFGPSESDGYVATIKGVEMRDLHRLVVETFQNPLYVLIYCISMITLFTHLRHGIWSAFQSLGVFCKKGLSDAVYKLAFVLAFIFAAGFFFIPVVIYFRN